MRFVALLVAIAATFATPVQAAEEKAAPGADPLPRRTYAIPRLPSELLEAPRAELDPIVAAIDKDIAHDLATLDIRDRAIRVGMLQARAQFAIHRGDWAAAKRFFAEMRAQQEKPADKLTGGITLTNIADTRMKGGSLEEQRARLKASLARAYGEMPWDVVGDNVKLARSGLEALSKDLIIGAMKARIDPAAKEMNLQVPDGMVVVIVANRNAFEHILPFRDDVLAVLKGLVDKHP
jgi:hypothetical protein